MADSKYVFLGMPSYGQMTFGASVGLWRSSKQHKVSEHYSSGSLLARSFNLLWASALNEQLAGQQIDYFAMLHSDVEPGPLWLDTMIAELEASDLDMLSAVVPLKSDAGLTSTALHDPDGDNFNPICRLTMTDVMKLPETFTSDDLDFPLLVNTGCWVIRFDPEWNRKLFFTINDRMSFSVEKGRYVPEVEPEDWFFSRLCHELELKIGATRKVFVNHNGGSQLYPNDHAWGTKEFDNQFVHESPVAASDLSNGALARQLQEI